jgi:hypothetical protein
MRMSSTQMLKPNKNTQTQTMAGGGLEVHYDEEMKGCSCPHDISSHASIRGIVHQISSLHLCFLLFVLEFSVYCVKCKVCFYAF